MKREFDKRVWKTGNSFVITIPSETVERYHLEGKIITVAITDEGSLILKKGERKNELGRK